MCYVRIVFFVFGWLSTSQGQFAPGVIGMPPGMGGYPMGGPLPFPLFPPPCDMGCNQNQGGLFFANINVNQGGSSMPMPGGMPGGGMPGMPGMPPPGGMPGGGMPTTTRPPTASPTRPPTGLPPTTMPPRPQQQPNMNAQFLYFVPNWCSGWCRFLYRPRPFFPPPPPPPPPPPILPMPLPRPGFLIFSWLGL
ncbi:basic proline-rich protein-like [Planococcus citri]|uniref:basic proline-rich protein-like n=1 Tax=Planococcus citri TaxID=170843 RepID=UPI0031F7E786